MLKLRMRAVKHTNGIVDSIQPIYCIDNKGYVCSTMGKPMWSLTKINTAGLTKEDVKGFRTISDVPDNLKSYIWKENETIDGSSFVGKPLCDEKTQKYLNATCSNLNYLDTVSGYEDALELEGYKILSTITSDDAYINSSKVELLALDKSGDKFWGLNTLCKPQ